MGLFSAEQIGAYNICFDNQSVAIQNQIGNRGRFIKVDIFVLSHLVRMFQFWIYNLHSATRTGNVSRSKSSHSCGSAGSEEKSRMCENFLICWMFVNFILFFISILKKQNHNNFRHVFCEHPIVMGNPSDILSYIIQTKKHQIFQGSIEIRILLCYFIRNLRWKLTKVRFD